MTNRKNPASEPGYSNAFTLAVTAMAISAVLLMGAVAALTPAAATSNVSIENIAAYDVPTTYFPAQYVNQATEIEPMPPTF